MKQILFLLLLVVAISSCEDDIGNNDGGTDPTEPITPNTQTLILDYSDIVDLPATPFNYANINLPNYFNRDNDIDNTPNGNPVSDWGATLGRVLFYDTKLSRNQTVSCASCHKAENGFSDDAQFSTGFNGELTGRNSMGLANAKFYNNGHFFWDERANTLEEQVLGPIQDPVEMGMTLGEVVERVEQEAYYRILFQEAFGDETVNADRISLALSQFVRSMLSYNSKYDAGRAQVNNPRDNFPNFTVQENQGKALFFSNRTNCDNCHGTESFVGPNARNNGLDLVYSDNGVGEITGNPNDFGDFKVPSLRNIELTAPYMHDGRFATLEEVIDHYSNGVQNHPNLSNQLRQGNQVRHGNFNNGERAALVAFLRTLTDNQFINDERYGNPFVE